MDKSCSREGFGVGVAFLAESAASKEIWKQGSQACLEKEQVVLTGWSMGSGGIGFVSYISWVWAQGKELWKKEPECENLRILEAWNNRAIRLDPEILSPF